MNQDQDSSFEEDEVEVDEEELEQLSEELIRVFNYEDIENNSNTEKEKLIQSIIKLGGKNYTVEDLRRDIIKIESEDKMKRMSGKEEKRTKEDPDRNSTDFDQNLCRSHLEGVHEEFVDKVYKELEKEEFTDIGNDRSSSPQILNTCHQELGL